MDKATVDIIATAVEIRNGKVHLHLADGSTHAFPLRHYPRLARASTAELQEVYLRVGGRALRWESIDEDIWIADALLQKYPRAQAESVAEKPARYPPR